jgi:bifunctional DNA-binding transcriptional regulator/antitoxin component of YhaV-PrlF toxin-antitoxin module
MSEEIAVMKVSVGRRIVLVNDVCEELGIKEGDKVVIYRNNTTKEIGIKKAGGSARVQQTA